MTTEVQERLTAVRERAHPRCMACSQVNGRNLSLHFQAVDDGGVRAWVIPSARFEGYPGMVHGGVIATLLDAAMTNCLFAMGWPAVTGELTIRYREPVQCGRACAVHAWLERASSPLFLVRAELTQDSRVRARASAKFILRQEPSEGS
ncbi:MAG: PaaI family thioesterase [Phycisphaerales bacterium]|nr:PaaI family thioesterase [Phycisphaerales bacterium]